MLIRKMMTRKRSEIFHPLVDYLLLKRCIYVELPETEYSCYYNFSFHIYERDKSY